MKTAIEVLRERLVERFPTLVATLDRPENPEGGGWLDVRAGDQELNVEWNPRLGFGVNARADALFGEGHDEVYPTIDEAYGRIEELIATEGKTQGAPDTPSPDWTHAA